MRQTVFSCRLAIGQPLSCSSDSFFPSDGGLRTDGEQQEDAGGAGGNVLTVTSATWGGARGKPADCRQQPSTAIDRPTRRQQQLPVLTVEDPTVDEGRQYRQAGTVVLVVE